MGGRAYQPGHSPKAHSRGRGRRLDRIRQRHRRFWRAAAGRQRDRDRQGFCASLPMSLQVNRVKAFVYIFSGACAGLVGVILASASVQARPSKARAGSSRRSCRSWSAARSRPAVSVPSPATVAGALLLGLVFNVLNFENGKGTISLSAYWQLVIRGAFLFAVILLQTRMTRVRKTAG